MISIEEFEEIYNLIPGEPEFELWFDEDGPTYMIIKYADCATFQRCGNGPRGSGEFEYPSLDALLSAPRRIESSQELESYSRHHRIGQLVP